MVGGVLFVADDGITRQAARVCADLLADLRPPRVALRLRVAVGARLRLRLRLRLSGLCRG